MEKNQRQQQYYARDNNANIAPVFRREQDTGEIVPGMSIMRRNTPRPSSFEAMRSSTGYSQKSLHGGSSELEKGELPRRFPGQAPSAPPLPEELEDNRKVGMGQNQILGLSFAEDDLLSATQVTQNGTTQARRQNWLITFSLYLAGLVLLLLFLAVLQGIGVARGTLLDGFAPLGVPWQVLIYGLLGGCVSCLVSLCNFRESDPPLFVMIAWFTRPFVGALLAIFSYILLTSGLFMLGESINRHPGFFWLAGMLAGLCEWGLFCRRRRAS